MVTDRDTGKNSVKPATLIVPPLPRSHNWLESTNTLANSCDSAQNTCCNTTFPKDIQFFIISSDVRHGMAWNNIDILALHSDTCYLMKIQNIKNNYSILSVQSSSCRERHQLHTSAHLKNSLRICGPGSFSATRTCWEKTLFRNGLSFPRPTRKRPYGEKATMNHHRCPSWKQKQVARRNFTATEETILLRHVPWVGAEQEKHSATYYNNESRDEYHHMLFRHLNGIHHLRQL